jgi:O-antigen ligase
MHIERPMRDSDEPTQPHFFARLSFWLLILAIALAPLPFGSNRPWAWSLLTICIGAAAFLWSIGTFMDSQTIQLSWGRYRLLSALFLVFMAWGFYQAIGPAPEAWWAPGWKVLYGTLETSPTGTISASSEQSLTAIMRLLAYAGVFWLALQVGRRTYYAKLALWSITLAGLAYSIYGIAIQLQGSNMILWFPKWSYQYMLTSTFVNRNHFAVYAGLSILCTVALIADDAKKATEVSVTTRAGFIQLLDNLSAQILILVIAFAALVTALFLTQSRAGAFSTALATASFLGVLAITTTFAAKSAFRFGVIIVIASGIFLGVSSSLLAVRSVQIGNDLSERFVIYKAAIHAIFDRPFLGFGLGTFASVFPAYRGVDFHPNGATYEYAHNVFIQLAFEAGIPAAFLLMLCFSIIIGVCLWGAHNRRRNGIFPALGVSATVLITCDGLVDFSVQMPAIAALYCLILGIAYTQSWTTSAAVGRQI